MFFVLVFNCCNVFLVILFGFKISVNNKCLELMDWWWKYFVFFWVIVSMVFVFFVNSLFIVIFFYSLSVLKMNVLFEFLENFCDFLDYLMCFYLKQLVLNCFFFL